MTKHFGMTEFQKRRANKGDKMKKINKFRDEYRFLRSKMKFVDSAKEQQENELEFRIYCCECGYAHGTIIAKSTDKGTYDFYVAPCPHCAEWKKK